MIPGPALANSKEASIFQDRAFKLGVSYEESFLFKTDIQVHALETLQNLKKEFTVQQALQFTKWVQVDALWSVDTIKEALIFSNYFQLSAFRAKVPIAQALLFTNNAQLNALYEGATLKEVLKIDKEPQAGPVDNTTLEGSVAAAPFELTESPPELPPLPPELPRPDNENLSRRGRPTLEGSVVAAPFELTELPEDTQEQSDAARSDPLNKELEAALNALEEALEMSPEELALLLSTDAEMDLVGEADAFLVGL